MSRHQIRLLLCSAAALALIVSALFAIEWFRIELALSDIAIDMRAMHVCTLDEGCRTVGLGRMSGFYPVVAGAGFWCALTLGLLVIAQCLAKLFVGSSSAIATRVGYVLGVTAFACAFGAGFLFGPETENLLDVVGIVVERTPAPSILLAGSLLATLALRYAHYDAYEDGSGQYQPIVLAKGDSGQRLPVTPLHVTPVSPRASTDSGASTRAGTDSENTKPPTLPEGRQRATTDSGRTKTGSQPPLEARTKSASQPPVIARGTAPMQPLEARTKSGSQPPLEAPTKSGSQPPLEARAKSGSQPPLVARAKSGSQPPLVARAKSGSQPPFVARTTSPSQPLVARTSSPSQPLVARTKSPSDQPIDPIARARTSSSGPIDLAARLGAAPIEVAIKPPLPEPVPVPKDQIPVAPESGLVIRKRTQSAGPISPDQIPVAPESGLVIRKKSPSSAPAPTGDTDVPVALRGRLKYAVTSATVTSRGITAQREDGASRLVEWDAVVGIIARRLPPEAPYEGATFVDLVSTEGATLRILPWTTIAGAPLHGVGEERARAFVQLVAARCLDAKLDSWTKVFSDGAGRPAQLPSTKTLDAHDEKLA